MLDATLAALLAALAPAAPELRDHAEPSTTADDAAAEPGGPAPVGAGPDDAPVEVEAASAPPPATIERAPAAPPREPPAIEASPGPRADPSIPAQRRGSTATVDGLRPVTWALAHPREHYWVPNAWPVRQPCDFTLTDHRACLVLSTEVFTGWRYDAVAGRDFNELRLDRGELGTAFVWQAHRRLEAGATVRLEAIRSAGPQSLQGIDGDSLVVRLLETYGQLVAHLGPVDLGARAGLVPERWIEQVHKGYDARAIGGTPSEKAQMLDRADVGATLTASGWEGLVELDLQLVDGEGRAQREQNPGKNTTAMLTVRPLQRRHDKGPIALAVHGGYRDGSLGVASLRSHRGLAAVTFASPWAYAGFEYAHALGYQARADVAASALGVWASAHVVAPWLGVLAAYDRTQADLAARGSVVQTVTAGAFSDLFPYVDRNRRRVRLHAVYQHDAHGSAAGALPGVPQALDTHRFMLQLQASGALRAF
jgi:hypothetical protein